MSNYRTSSRNILFLSAPFSCPLANMCELSPWRYWRSFETHISGPPWCPCRPPPSSRSPCPPTPYRSRTSHTCISAYKLWFYAAGMVFKWYFIPAVLSFIIREMRVWVPQVRRNLKLKWYLIRFCLEPQERVAQHSGCNIWTTICPPRGKLGKCWYKKLQYMTTEIVDKWGPTNN